MHTLIIQVTRADSVEGAVGFADAQVNTQDGQLTSFFDYGMAMNNDSARFTSGMPDVVTETGGIRADQPEAVELIESAYDNQMDELARNLAVIKKAVAELDDEAILDDVRVEADVDEWNPFGLARDESELSETFSSTTRHAMASIGRYVGPETRIYWDYNAVRTPSQYEKLASKLDSHGEEFYVVPLDVHY